MRLFVTPFVFSLMVILAVVYLRNTIERNPGAQQEKNLREIHERIVVKEILRE